MKKIYLAAPYMHRAPLIMEIRAKKVDQKAAELMEAGYRVFSPLSHSVPISRYCTVDQDHDFWMQQDLWILKVCDELHILCLDGWERSVGVRIERDLAWSLNIRVVYHKE